MRASPWRSTPGEFSGRASPGAIHPALPQDAPAATPVRSTTETSTPRSCKNHAVDNPMLPAPTTIADRGPPVDPLDADRHHTSQLNFGDQLPWWCEGVRQRLPEPDNAAVGRCRHPTTPSRDRDLPGFCGWRGCRPDGSPWPLDPSCALPRHVSGTATQTQRFPCGLGRIGWRHFGRFRSVKCRHCGTTTITVTTSRPRAFLAPTSNISSWG